MTYSRTFLIGASAGTALFWSTGACAQDAPQPRASTSDIAAPPKGSAQLPTKEVPSDVIIVTAQKRAERLDRVGLSVSAITHEQLSEQRITSVQDVALAVPSLKFSDSGTGLPIYTLRGIGFNEESLGVYPSVSVYTDEVPLPFSVLTLHAAYDLERIEVLKGPQGTLFGQNATGGAINYIAAKPTKDLRYGADVSYGRFNQIDGNAFISGALGPRVMARVAVSGLSRDGWQNSITRPDDRNAKQKYLAGRLTLDWAPVDTLRLRFSVNAWRDKSEPQAGQLIAVRAQVPTSVQPVFGGAPFPELEPRSADWNPGTLSPRSDRKFIQGSLRADIDLGDFATLTSITSYLDFKQRNLFSDRDGSPAQVANLGPVHGDITSFNQELRIANAGKDRFRWVLGGNYEDSRTLEDQTLNFGNGSSSNPGTLFINKVSAVVLQKIRNYALFANGEYDVADRLTIKIGGRYTKSRNRDVTCDKSADGRTDQLFNILGTIFGTVPFTPIGPNDCYTLNFQGVPGQPFHATLSEHNFSWRVGADYRLSDQTLFYANVSRGYKAGSFPVVHAAVFSEFLPVTQESVTAYEAGVKTSFGRAVHFNAAAFYYDYRDKQVRGKIVDPVFDVLDTLRNVPKSRVYGAEAEITVRPTPGMVIRGGVTYLDTKVLSKNGKNFITPTAYGNSCTSAGAPSQCDVTGTKLPFSPKWSYSADLSHRLPMSNGSAIFGGVGLRGQSKSISTLYGDFIKFRQLPGDRSHPNIDLPFVLPSFLTFDARLGYELPGGRAKVMLWGKNIFNKYYVTNTNHYLDATVRFTGQPATYGVSLSFKN